MSQINIDDRIDWIRFYSERLPTPPRPAGDHKYNACCPFHQERNPSFWFNTKNGCWKCETGCGSGNATTFLARYDGTDTAEAWKKLCDLAGVSRAEKAPERPQKGHTLKEYAEAKHFDEEWLKQLGLGEREGRPGFVTIPYYDEAGICVAVKRRYHPTNTQRFGWDKGARVIPYGVWLDMNKNGPALVLCEGESDAQALWLHKIPALGIPGATNYRKDWTARFIGDRDVYVHVEPDAGGATFKQKVLQALHDSGYKGRARVFSVHDIDPKCKDPSDLHTLYGDRFREMLDPVLKKAEPVDLEECLRVYDAVTVPPPEKQEKAVQPLAVYHASELYGKQLARPPMIVRGMIPAGLTALAGKPKQGKSWLSLLLGVCVAAGDPFLGAETTQGDVLYLDLESRQYRVQSRLGQILAGRAPERLYVAHESLQMEGGLIEQLGMWCDSVEKPVLIIIDTLSRVKVPGKRGENAYEADSRLYAPLQAFGLEHGLAVVVVHHLRKGDPQNLDFTERMSGSMGLAAVSDCIIGIDREKGSNEAKLSIRGRDFDEQELVIGFEKGLWTLRSNNSETYQEDKAYNGSPYVRALIAMAHRYHRWVGTPSGLLEELAVFGADTESAAPSAVLRELMLFRERLHNKEGVLIRTARKAKGRREVTVQEVQRDGF